MTPLTMSARGASRSEHVANGRTQRTNEPNPAQTNKTGNGRIKHGKNEQDRERNKERWSRQPRSGPNEEDRVWKNKNYEQTSKTGNKRRKAGTRAVYIGLCRRGHVRADTHTHTRIHTSTRNPGWSLGLLRNSAGGWRRLYFGRLRPQDPNRFSVEGGEGHAVSSTGV